MATSNEVYIRCYYCGRDVAAEVVHVHKEYSHGGQRVVPRTRWLQCGSCGEGSVMNAQGIVYPSAPAGRPVQGLPDEVANAWREARTAHAVTAYTAAEVMCRKILMYVAVDKANSKVRQSFKEHVDDLAAAGLFAPSIKPAVDKVRDRGNDAAHELPHTTEQESLATLGITEHLLRGVYEIPAI